MPARGYQVGFYESHEGVRDPQGRQLKAEKITYLLKTFGRCPLEAAVCLDVGCASGFITASLAPLFKRTVGIEYDGAALQSAPRDAPVRFLRGDAMRLPLANHAVDVVICAQVYEHMPDDEQLAAEIYRVLKPGGIVFFSGPNKLFPIEPHYFLPFLHWLPSGLANAYLRLFGHGGHYYERSRTFWGLQRLWARFAIQDVTLDLLRANPAWLMPKGTARGLARIPTPLWEALLPLLPNFNWMLFKSGKPE